MAVICLAVLLLNLLWHSSGSPALQLSIRPQRPLVERGGSVRLSCSMDCPSGKLQWVGLDTDLGDVDSNNATYSVLTVTNANVNMEGRKLCEGQCQRRASQAKVELKVYSFPDALQLDSEPKSVIAGQPARLACSMSHVYPHGALTLSWSRDGERLAASEETEEDEIEEDEEQLFAYRSVLEVPAAAAGTGYKCKATLEVGGRTFERERAVLVGNHATEEIPTTVEETTYTPLKTVGTSHDAATPEPPTTDGQNSSLVVTTGGPLLPTERPTTEASTVTATAAHTLGSVAKTHSTAVVTDGTSGSPSPAGNPISEMWTRSPTPQTKADTTGNPTSTLPPAVETSAKLGVTSQQAPPSTDQRFTTGHVSTKDYCSTKALTEKPRSSTVKEDLCRPEITPAPRQGTTGEAFRITCRAVGCSARVQIRWVETPVAQSQYGREADSGWSTLTVASIRMEHQGDYRCIVVATPSQMASLRVVVSAATFSTDSLITLGTAGSLLGLIVTGYVSHRLRRRRQKS